MMSQKNFIISTANNILSDSQALRKHMWKTKPCPYGHNCKNFLSNGPSECGDAHFLEEYRIPMCLFLEFCQKKDCKMYHPHLGAPHEYISFMGINRNLLSRQEWENKRTTYNFARAFMADKERLRQHLFKTRSCQYGAECKNKENCQNAHFFDEYRIPVCLFMNFCDEKGCQYFHPSRETNEKFIEEKSPKFKYASSAAYEESKYKKEKVMSLLLPISCPNPLAVPSVVKIAENAKTKFCSFVKEKQMCKKMGCTYAHSIDELVVNGRESLQEKIDYLEKRGKDIPLVFVRPVHKNWIKSHMEWEQMKIFKQIQAEENGEPVEEDDEDTKEKEIEEVLEEIEKNIEEESEMIEIFKDEFLRDLEFEGNEEFDEFDEGIVMETFTYPHLSLDANKYKIDVSEKFLWGDDDSDEYYEGDQE